MCGIAGAVGHVDDELCAAIARASDSQAHRGPDAHGSWRSADRAGPGVAFWHRRLAIIDLSEDGVQPMIDPESGIAIVFNGEIYNFRELRAELEALGTRFRSNSDTEVLLKAWARWGSSCIERLRGMFAFGLYDPARRSLVLARDRLGIKPVYVARVSRAGSRDALIFASEVRALLATELVERRLDPQGLGSFLWHGFVAGPQAIVRGVRRLEPGTVCTISLDTLEERTERYWSLPRRAELATSVEELEAELLEAVRLRLVSDVPLGVFLSGGIDSSAVTALAVRAAGPGIRTFTVSFGERDYDESRHARAVARSLGTDHHDVPLSELDFKAHLPEALSSIDQPTFDAINTYFVSRAVRDAGITVALAGTGGDELFGGYSSFRDLPRMQLASRIASALPARLRRRLAELVARAKLGAFGAVPPQTRWGKLADALDQDGRLVDLYQIAYAIFVPGFLRELAPDLAASGLRSGLDSGRADALERALAGQPALHAISMLELTSFVGERLLPDTDAASMAASLEVRVPLLDHRVVERLAGVGLKRRFEPLGRKALLREVALRGLDPRLFERPKQGFELPIGEWVRLELRDQVGSTLRDREACAAAGLDPSAVTRLWNSFQAGAPGMYWSRVWAVFVLLDWCRRHRVTR